MKRIFVVLLCLGLLGCATTSDVMNRLSLGMTKPEVIKAMGQPDHTKAEYGREVLEYRLHPARGYWTSVTYPEPYWVELQDGKVVRYGRAGDFGTSQPQDRREYDININK